MNILIKIFLGIIVSFYLFPVGLVFLPIFLSTKMILTILGVGLFTLENIRISEVKINFDLLVSVAISIFFSVICYYAALHNDTDDYSYANYIVSFFVWLSASYSVFWFFKRAYGFFSFRQFVFYLNGVCVFQCITALLINNVPSIRILVDSIFIQGQGFLHEIGRLYGIGASLDPAGVRFAIVLVLTASLLIKDQYVRNNSKIYFLLLVSFFTVGIIGNMISRTTILGFGFGFVYLLYASGLFSRIIQYRSFKATLIFISVLAFIVFFAVYIYQTSEEYRTSLRFAFEGFFNWFETGEWRTGSTDKLNKEMWIWPETTEGWIIGTGIFGNFVYSTDIGYCRFILYCGIVGFSCFSLLFIYNSLAFMFKVPQYRIMFFVLGVLPFIIWIKVATDIFFIYALFYCIDSFSTEDPNEKTIEHEIGI